MAAPIRPASVPTMAHDNWFWVPALASVTAPKITELTAASALDITEIAMEEGTTLPTVTAQNTTGNMRLGDSVQYQIPSPAQSNGGQITFQLDPQSAAGSDGRKFWSLILGGVNGFLVNRRELAIATALAAAQIVDVWPVYLSDPVPTLAGSGAASESAALTIVSLTGPGAYQVTLA